MKSLIESLHSVKRFSTSNSDRRASRNRGSTDSPRPGSMDKDPTKVPPPPPKSKDKTKDDGKRHSFPHVDYGFFRSFIF